jgi:hypothetical protein
MHPIELHFFDAIDPDMKKYESCFETDKLIVGEKTPAYNYLRYAMDRIHDYDPNMKLVLILREPISRAYSQYNMNVMMQEKTLDDVTDQQMLSDFEEDENIELADLRKNGNYYIIRGKYDEILAYILSKFPRKNLYIGIAEEIKADKQKYYNEIIVFLGASRIDKINDTVDVHVREYAKPIPKILEKKLYNIYEPHNKKLYEMLGRKIQIWENYYDLLKISP